MLTNYLHKEVLVSSQNFLLQTFLTVCPFRGWSTRSPRPLTQRPPPDAHPGSWRKQNPGFPGAFWTCQSRRDTLSLQGCQLWALPSVGPALSGIMEKEPGALDIAFGCPGSLNRSFSGHICLIGDNWPASCARLLETDSYI